MKAKIASWFLKLAQKLDPSVIFVQGGGGPGEEKPK